MNAAVENYQLEIIFRTKKQSVIILGSALLAIALMAISDWKLW